MKLTLFMTLAAIVALLFGLAFLLVPAGLLSLYGVTLDSGGQWIARYLGSAFLAIAAMTWLGRAASGPGLRAILVGDFVLAITGLLVAIFDRLYGVGNMLVWSTLGIYLLLSLGFGYFVLLKPSTS
jgi:hypothetical protein